MVKLKVNKTLRNVLIAVLVIAALFATSKLFPEKDFHKKYEGVDLKTSSGVVSTTTTYNDYLQAHSSAKNASSTVNVDIFAFDKAKSYGTHAENNFSGKNVVVTDDRSSVTWKVEIPESGFYNVSIEYIATPSRNVNMERIFYINGEMPFTGADTLSFNRLWKDESKQKKYDNQGNEIRQTQIEFFDYQTVLFKSDLGYEVEPYRFYFEKGINTITLESTNEPMAISRLSLVPVTIYDTYEQYLAKQPSNPDSDTKSGFTLKLQGEDNTARSDPSLFSRYDRSSASTEPYDVKHTTLNYTGGDSWKIPGQWIEWNFEIPEDGWYTISVKGRQLFQRGYVACRSVYIDGKIPVDALKSIGFEYSTDWKLVTLADAQKNPYKFYLTKGEHSIRLECTLGEIGELINELQDSIYRLNQIYRTILVLTGTTPDQFRDYEIHKVYPNEVEAMNLESRRLYRIIDRYVEVTGQKSDKIAPAETLAVQLEQFYKHPDRITKAFTNFKENTTSLGSSLLTLTESKLDVDYILIQNAADAVKPIRTGFFKNAAHSIKSFVSSFLVDSASLGNIYDEDEEHVIEAWIVTTGRDQAQILKNMVDDSFCSVSDVKCNVKLINPNSLLNAVVAGNGPDVVISTYQSHPVDYALRNANVNLMRFDDCEEVLKRFKPSAYNPYKYNGGLYALPEQETFNLLFYRKDILEQLELEVPQTWDEFIELLPTLQGNNLTAAVPYPQLVNPDVGILYSMIYQNGGQVYNEKGTKTCIDSEEGVKAFKKYSGLFVSYGLPWIYDFPTRFRSGEMPIGIANYSTYNTLVVSAPEIRGQWDFTYLVGTPREDGTIDRTNVAGTLCCMMIKKGTDLTDLDPNEKDARVIAAAKKNDQRQIDSWEFMKWWTSTDAQVRFGREIEAILGSSARYATANVEALKQLSWNSRQIEILENSLDETIGVPEVPGSYYTPRHVVNGTRRVVNEKSDPRETLIDYTRKINEELKRKRQEFNLPFEED